MMRIVYAEWTKLRTLSSSAWLILSIVTFTVALGLLITASMDIHHCPAPCIEDTTKLSLTGVRLGQVAVVVLAVLIVSNEYATRMMLTTLTATPRRTLVLAGKIVVVTVVSLFAAVAGVLGSYLVARRVLPGNGFAIPSLADDLTRRAVIGSILYMGLIALLSAGVAAIVRDTAGSITLVLALLYLAPILAGFVSSDRWQHRLYRYAPMEAGLAIQTTIGSTHIGPWAGLGVLAAYAGVALSLGIVVFRLRDA